MNEHSPRSLVCDKCKGYGYYYVNGEYEHNGRGKYAVDAFFISVPVDIECEECGGTGRIEPKPMALLERVIRQKGLNISLNALCLAHDDMEYTFKGRRVTRKYVSYDACPSITITAVAESQGYDRYVLTKVDIEINTKPDNIFDIKSNPSRKSTPFSVF